MSKTRGSPRKFSEKIALLNKKEAEATAEFEKILKEVGETTARGPAQPTLGLHHSGQQLHHQFGHEIHDIQHPKQYYGLPQRSSSFSHWQRCPPLQQPLQHQNHGQYLTQPVQYNQSNQMHQQQSPQQTSQAPMYVDQHMQHHPAGAYINRPAQLQNHHRTQPQPLQHQAQPLQRVLPRQHVTSNSVGLHDESAPPASLGVPNIEIFRIDDDQTYQQVTSAPIAAPDSLTDGHYRYDCSNSSISSARSLPNIANLSVSQPAKCFFTQTSTDQRLMPTVTTSTTTSPATDGNQSSPEPMMTNSHQSSSYITSDYQYNNDEYCSLPAICEPVPTTMNGTTGDISRQSQASISRENSWQSVVTSSAPCSAAPTPPLGVVQSTNGFDSSPQHQQQHSPGSTSRQQSPHQLLHQDYYPTQQFQPQVQMQRASSTNIINKYPANELLEAPRVDTNLSKSSEACYGYLDSYGAGRGIDCSSQIQTGDSDNYGPTSLGIVNPPPNPLMRSRSGNDLDNLQMQGPPRKLSNCITTDQQHFVDTMQYQFYG